MTTRSMPEIGELLRTQDNRMTSHPIFLVQQRVRMYGFDPIVASTPTTWLDYDGTVVPREKADKLEAGYQAGERTPVGYTRTGYLDRWEFVAPFFTQAAADEFIDENRHRLHEPRVYVESGHRNPEWQAVREFLISLPVTADPVLAAQSSSLGTETGRWSCADPTTSAEPRQGLEPVRLPDGSVQGFTLKMAGKSFRCPCGCNVFHKPDASRPEIYECNACGNWFESE